MSQVLGVNIIFVFFMANAQTSADGDVVAAVDLGFIQKCFSPSEKIG